MALYMSAIGNRQSAMDFGRRKIDNNFKNREFSLLSTIPILYLLPSSFINTINLINPINLQLFTTYPPLNTSTYQLVNWLTRQLVNSSTG
jgi:hypothetical protein